MTKACLNDHTISCHNPYTFIKSDNYLLLFTLFTFLMIFWLGFWAICRDAASSSIASAVNTPPYGWCSFFLDVELALLDLSELFLSPFGTSPSPGLPFPGEPLFPFSLLLPPLFVDFLLTLLLSIAFFLCLGLSVALPSSCSSAIGSSWEGLGAMSDSCCFF